MNAEIEKKLDEVIMSKVEEINNLDSDSDEYASAMGDLKTLGTISLDVAKARQDDENKKRQLEEQAKDRKVSAGLKIGTILAGLLVTVGGIAYEKKDVIGSPALRNMFSGFTNILKPK